MRSAILSFFLLLTGTQAFAPSASKLTSHLRLHGSRIPIGDPDTSTPSSSALDTPGSPIDGFLEDIQMRIRIAQESNAAGNPGKQVLADILAGEYDANEVESKIEEAIASAPCVMFTWESSPSCKKAVEAFSTVNADVKIVRLDDPWGEGNPMRAVLGKQVGRTSVPFIFVDGKYIGGFDGPGVEENEDAPGMVDLAFKGTLRDILKDAGAMKD